MATNILKSINELVEFYLAELDNKRLLLASIHQETSDLLQNLMIATEIKDRLVVESTKNHQKSTLSEEDAQQLSSMFKQKEILTTFEPCKMCNIKNS